MKNANGMGTVVKRKGVRKPYLVYSAAEMVTGGKYKRRYLGSFATRKEAEECRMRNYFHPVTDADFTPFEDVCLKYLNSARFKALSASTQRCYCLAFEKAKSLHNKPIKAIRTADLQRLIDNEAEEGLSQASQKLLRAFFSVIFKEAMKDDLIEKDYSAFLTVSKNDSPQKRSFTDLELAKIYKASETDLTARIVLYLCLTGWRISEAADLTVFNFDPDSFCFKGGIKTAAGKGRLVPTHPLVRDFVTRQLSKGPLLSDPDGSPISPTTFRLRMKALLTQLGIDPSMTPHSCRHTFSTLAKRGKMDDFYRRSILGHSQNGITDQVYTHCTAADLTRAVEEHLCIDFRHQPVINGEKNLTNQA